MLHIDKWKVLDFEGFKSLWHFFVPEEKELESMEEGISFVKTKLCVYPCGGGVEYLHCDPASRKRRRNGTKKGHAIA
jgi:hypothetical protein